MSEEKEAPAKNNFLEKLKARWELKSNFQVIVVLIVFAITGSTTAYVTKPIYKAVGIESGAAFWVKVLAFIFIMTPVYQVILLIIGTLLGQFRFFWNFEKKMWSRFLPKKS